MFKFECKKKPLESKAIGGYFELELNKGEDLYDGAKFFNSARSAFQSALKACHVKKVFVPCYICSVMIDQLKSIDVEFIYYRLSGDLEILECDAIYLDDGDVILYVNYFGLKDEYISYLFENVFGERLIIDNSQALFSSPLPGALSIYSPRKFVGIPDGGFLLNAPEPVPELVLESLDITRVKGLLGRLSGDAEGYYSSFLEAERCICKEGVKGISWLSLYLLRSIDYIKIKERRRNNINTLREYLDSHNDFTFWVEQSTSLANKLYPLCYPLLINCKEMALLIRNELKNHRIYLPVYWSDDIEGGASCLNDGEMFSVRHSFSKCLLPLPIDQRYTYTEMKSMAIIILTVLEKGGMSIKGAKILLRALNEEDMPTLYRWSNDEELWYLLGGWHFPVSMVAQRDWLISTTGDELNQRFGIEVDQYGLIGTANLTSIDWKNRVAEHGMMIGNLDMRGKGYGVDVVSTVMRYAFEELGLARLSTTIIEYNTASVRLYTEKCPWKIEGIQASWYFRKGKRWSRYMVGVSADDYLNWLKGMEK